MKEDEARGMVAELLSNKPLTAERRTELAKALDLHLTALNEAQEALSSVQYILADAMWMDGRRINDALTTIHAYDETQDKSGMSDSVRH